MVEQCKEREVQNPTFTLTVACVPNTNLTVEQIYAVVANQIWYCTLLNAVVQCAAGGVITVAFSRSAERMTVTAGLPNLRILYSVCHRNQDTSSDSDADVCIAIGSYWIIL
jgi:hypothetical protein